MSDTGKKWLLACGVIFLVACLCLSVVGIGGAALVFLTRGEVSQTLTVPLPTIDVFPNETETPQNATPAPFEPVPTRVLGGDEAIAAETLQTLRDTLVPVNDPLDIAARLMGITGVSPTLPAPASPYRVGDQKSFWVTNTDTDETRQVTAVLRYATDVVYFWVEDGVKTDDRALKRLADAFSQKIVPTNREFFGSEWTPGVDSDPHLYVLYVSNIGVDIAGYYSSSDEVPPAVNETSNGHEMFVLSADNVALDEEYTYGTMAHEFQHMIHYYRDKNEESWLNEGFSVLAEMLNGYETGGFDYLFMLDPDLPLAYWPDPSQSTPHYGASFLFVTYFLDRFGEDATKALVAHPENGMESIDLVLRERNLTDPLTGNPITADSVFADWTVANYLQDKRVGDGRYTYSNYDAAPQASPTEYVETCPSGTLEREVNQYGADYIQITCPGEHTLIFQGATTASLLPESPYSGDYAFWSNKGDESDMTLTRKFDFSGVKAPITLRYRMWYDLEENYDYLYLVASTDGKTWEMVETPSGTDDNPVGNNLGWGYNGASGGWVEEEVDLSQYAGKQVYLRFEYITDAAVNGEGFLLDDVAVDAVGYFSDFEQDEGGWEAHGFARVANLLPQTFRVTLILENGKTQVIPLELDETQRIEYSLHLKGMNARATLVVSGTTRFTVQPAYYSLEIR